MEDWLALLESENWRAQLYRPLIEAIVQDPKAARVNPILSMDQLVLSRCPEYPFDVRDLPSVEWTESGFRIDDGPPLPAAEAVQLLLPRMRAVEVYPGSFRE